LTAIWRCDILARMSEFNLAPAARFSSAQRAALLTACFAGYYVPLRMNAEQMELNDRLYDVDAGASVVALNGAREIGMALLSRRGERGWVSAVGVLPEWRRRGVARAIMRRIIDNAAAIDLRHITLEAIDRNTAARQLYLQLGFREMRELLSWQYPADGDPLPIPRELLNDADPDVLLDRFPEWHEQSPSWQREEDTLRRLAYRLQGFLLEMDGGPAAYCLASVRTEMVSIFDLGIDPKHGPVRAGRTLLQALAHQYRGRGLSITNVPADDGICRALAALRFQVTIRQVEMGIDVTSNE
jgi:ribosomal protein S18 acetylase RimI-like enzyme